MADRELSTAIGEALIALVEWARPRASARVDELLERVAEVVRPQPPMTLRTLDGQIVTGLVVLDRGQALLFIGVREPAPAVVTPPPVRDRFDDDGVPSWARNVHVDPYRR